MDAVVIPHVRLIVPWQRIPIVGVWAETTAALRDVISLLTAIARPRRPAKPMASATRIALRTAPWQRTLIAVAWEGMIVVPPDWDAILAMTAIVRQSQTNMTIL